MTYRTSTIKRMRRTRGAIERLDAQIIAALVVPRSEIWELASVQIDSGPAPARRRTHLEGDWTDPLRAVGLRVTTRLLRGEPGAQLCKLAETRAADLLVIGAKSHSAVPHLLGGIAHKVANHAHVQSCSSQHPTRRRVDHCGLAHGTVSLDQRSLPCACDWFSQNLIDPSDGAQNLAPAAPVIAVPDEQVHDPECGMTVNINPSTQSLTREGQTWWFCATGCRDQFTNKASTASHTPSGGRGHDMDSRR